MIRIGERRLGGIDDALEPAQERSPVPRTSVQLGEMDGLDRARRSIRVAPTLDEQGAELIPRREIPYDTLVIAVGSRTNDFGTPGAQEHAISLDTAEQAAEFHRRLINACIRANSQREPLRPEQLNVAIIGAGATGVELAAELHKTTRELVAYGLDRIDPERDIRITVIEAAPRILPALPERLSKATGTLLRDLKVEVLTGERVTAVHADGVTTGSGREVPAELTVWAAGIKAPDFLKDLDGLETNRVNQLVVTDLRMGGMDGMALFEALRAAHPTVPVIILTAHGTIPDAVAAVQRGVFGYLTKPFEPKALLNEVERALAVGGAAGPAGDGGDDWRRDIITRNPAMEDVLAKARMVAESDASVFIQGESGTGKELLANAIHRASRRREHAFVAINCGAIPEQLLESELFGHVKGSFTGAVRDNRGLFQTANRGTLFLDEIGDMPVSLQVKLLRVLQEKKVRPVGSTEAHDVDVRVISATHRNLEAEMAAGNFREDLYYRLNVVALTLPPLAERREDIPLLANHFLATLAQKYRKTVNALAPEALELMVSASWPGNVRQLYNVVEQSVALATAPLIPLSLAQQPIQHQQAEFASFEEARRRFEREYLTQLLKITEGNVTQAARLAKRNRTEFYKLLGRHQLDPKLFKAAYQGERAT